MASRPSRSAQHASYCKSCSLAVNFKGTSTSSEILFGMTNTRDRSRSTAKTGEWSDFAIGKSGGDLISLVAYLGGISQVDAARELAARFGIQVPKLSSGNAEKPDASLVMPVPADAPAPPTTHPTRGRPSQSWPYKDAAGGVIGYVLRFDRADGKEFRPLTLWRDSFSGRLEW